MHRLAIVPERLLSEPLRVATLLRALRPGVAVGVERNAFDAQPHAALVEFGGAIAGANRRQVGKQSAGHRETAQNRLNALAKVNHGEAAGFPPGVSDCLIRPVNVVRLETGNVALRSAKIPAQLIIAAPLRIFLPLNDQSMFLSRDSASRLKSHLRPETFGNKRPGKPIHRKAEVVELAQMHVGTDRSRLEAGKKLFSLGLGL